MSEEEVRCVALKIPKNQVIHEDKDYVWVSAGTVSQLIRMIGLAYANPNKAISVKRDEDEDTLQVGDEE